MKRPLIVVVVLLCGSCTSATGPADDGAPGSPSPQERVEDKPVPSPAALLPTIVPSPTAIPAPCAAEGYEAPPDTKIELIALATGTQVDVGLRNAGSERVCVYSHIATHEWQSDWLTIQYQDGHRYHHTPRSIALNDERDRSAAISLWLEPGEELWHTVDAAAWAARPRNGSEPLKGGLGYAHAVYDTREADGAWRGHLSARVEDKAQPSE